ncbi:hypothetical protein Leryth_009564 [Lithospermum erythrorhizon]|nr:hypothetical protein Leryth_009564 [Lithospermum erythrorhizon]
MRAPNEEVVEIVKGKKSGEPYIVTVNCPDNTGLACDICRTILDFGLCISKGDVSTDGIWCYIVLWVVPHCDSTFARWASLKERLLSVCPSSPPLFLLNPSSPRTTSPVFLLKLYSLDRRGLLHDVTRVLCELELTIQSVKVTTTPDDRVLDLFFITDNLELLHIKERQDETCERLHAVLGESCSTCELQLAGNQYDNHLSVSSLSPVVGEELFRCDLSDKESRSQALSPDVTMLKKATVAFDNSLCPAHTLLQISCVDHKGFLYDIAYGRFFPVNKGQRELDIFIHTKNGKKVLDPDKQDALSSRLKMEMLHPLRVIIAHRGPNTELIVANPVELSGKGRPLVFYDVTLSLKNLEICIFSAEIGRYSTADREWEVYRFLLDDNCKFQLSNMVVTNQIVDKVRRTLMGW